MFLVEYFGEGGLGVHPNCSQWNTGTRGNKGGLCVHPNCSQWNTGIRGNKGGLGLHLNCSQYYTGTIRENEEGLGVI